VSPGSSRQSFEAGIDFLVDTGADVTVLGASDLTERLGIAMSATEAGDEFAAVGQRLRARKITGFLFLEHDDGQVSGFHLDFAVPPGPPDAFDVSLIGCDIILAGRLALSAEEVLLDLPPLRRSQP
jgi:hypothetical protein